MNAKDEAVLTEQFVRYADGHCTEMELCELSARLECEPEVRDLFSEVLMQGAAVREYAQTHPQPVALNDRAPHRWRMWFWSLTAVASFMFAAVLWIQTGRDDAWVMRATEVSGNVRWTGRGGSSVENLVSPQPAEMPMKVSAGDAVVEVLGTSFSLNCSEQPTVGVVNIGSVQVLRKTDMKVHKIEEGQQAIVSKEVDFIPSVGTSVSDTLEISFPNSLPKGWMGQYSTDNLWFTRGAQL